MTNSPGWLCQAVKNRVPFGLTLTWPLPSPRDCPNCGE